jgi:hypothetical protein
VDVTPLSPLPPENVTPVAPATAPAPALPPRPKRRFAANAIVVLLAIAAAAVTYYGVLYAREGVTALPAPLRQYLAPEDEEPYATYERPEIGLTLSYPASWIIKEEKGVDASLGVTIFLPSGAGDSINEAPERASVGAGVMLEPFVPEDALARIESAETPPEDSSYRVEVLEASVEEVGGQRRLRTLTKTTYDGRVTLEESLTIEPSYDGLPAGPAVGMWQLGLFAYVGYAAEESRFNPARAERILSSLEERLAAAYLERSLDGKPLPEDADTRSFEERRDEAWARYQDSESADELRKIDAQTRTAVAQRLNRPTMEDMRQPGWEERVNFTEVCPDVVYDVEVAGYVSRVTCRGTERSYAFEYTAPSGEKVCESEPWTEGTWLAQTNSGDWYCAP